MFTLNTSRGVLGPGGRLQVVVAAAVGVHVDGLKPKASFGPGTWRPDSCYEEMKKAVTSFTTYELPLVAAMAHDGTGIKLDEQTRFSNPVIRERLGQLSQITSCDSLEERRHHLRGGGSGDGSHSSRSISALAQWWPGGCGRRAVRPAPHDARCRVRAID